MIALINPWGWAILAAILAFGEILAPGVFLVWLAAAAGVTALATALLPLAWEVQLVLFAALSVVAVIAGRTWLGADVSEPADPALNRRAERLLGTVVIVADPILNGRGRVQVGDSAWRAEGPDLPAGARARIVAVEGATLHVEAA